MRKLLILCFVLPLAALAARAQEAGKIAFTSDRDGNFEIYIMNADGTDQANLTNSAAFDWYPDCSPDGSTIIFGSYRAADPNDENIYAVDADGGNLKRLTASPTWEGFGAWSPDGSRIAFCSYRGGAQDIYVMNADGSGVTRITNDAQPDYYPDWSADGSRIVYMAIEPGYNCEIYVVNVDGSGKTNLTNHPATDGYPSWSPDGTRIAFNREEGATLSICVMDPDGSNLTPLTSGGVPRWSPDGSRIVFQAGGQGGGLDIYTVNADGTNRVNLTMSLGPDAWPTWCPVCDGYRITSLTGSATELTVGWHGPAGRIHSLERAPLLSPAGWQEIVTIPKARADNETTVIFPPGDKMGFYRVKFSGP